MQCLIVFVLKYFREFITMWNVLPLKGACCCNVYSIRDTPFTTCSSSSIAHLHVKMHNFDDCLCLLDGRLSQLQTLALRLEYIRDGYLIRKNQAKKNQSIRSIWQML